MRSRTPGFLRKPRGEGLIVIRRVFATELAWHDVRQNLDAGVRLDDAGRNTLATISVSGSDLRLVFEGARGFGPSLPERALVRLHDLCQTAASL